MRSLGRFLQVLGLVLLPLGVLYGQEGGSHSMTLEFGLLIGGALIFVVGTRLGKA